MLLQTLHRSDCMSEHLLILATAMFVLLHYRIRTHVIPSAETDHARRAARYMVIYPIVYVFCTLPLASMRMASIAGNSVSFTALSAAGAMITSNGWLDVLLYTLTRRVLVLSDADADEKLDQLRGLDTFAFRPDKEWGTTTTITALNAPKLKGQHAQHHPKGSKGGSRHAIARLASRHGSEEELWQHHLGGVGSPGVKKETTVQVRSEPMEMTNFAGYGNESKQGEPMGMADFAEYMNESKQSEQMEMTDFTGYLNESKRSMSSDTYREDEK